MASKAVNSDCLSPANGNEGLSQAPSSLPRPHSGVSCDAEPKPALIVSGIIVFSAALFAISLTGLPQFSDNEGRLSAYILDVLQNGRWFCPTDASGDVISKPPMLAWLGVVGAALTGGVNAFALYWPTAAATMATATLLFVYGRKFFDWRVGLLSAVAYVCSYIGLSQMSMPRYDGLLALPVTAAAFAAFSAWQTGRGWTWFWLFAALGTLVKGPIAVLLPTFGPGAYLWERRSHRAELTAVRGSHWTGVTLFLLLIGGWFALAYAEMGQPLIDKMLGRELVRHALEGKSGAGPLSGFAEPTKFFLGIYAPWSLVAAAGFWRIIRRPASNPMQRRLERFLLLWFGLGMVMFSVAAHQRGRLMYPVIPTAAMVAGLQLRRWTTGFPVRRLLVICGAAAAVFLAGCFVYTHVLISSSRRVQETLAMKLLADRVKRTSPGELPLTYVHSPLALQVWLNTRQREVGPAEAAALLAGATPAFVVTKDASAIRAATPGDIPIHEVFSWSTKGSSVVVLSNRPRLP